MGMRNIDWKEEMAASASSGESLTVVMVVGAAMMAMVIGRVEIAPPVS